MSSKSYTAGRQTREVVVNASVSTARAVKTASVGAMRAVRDFGRGLFVAEAAPAKPVKRQRRK